MDNPPEQGLKRIRDEMKQPSRVFPSCTKEARRESNKKLKQNKTHERGRLEFYYKTENEKVELFNKMDKLKLFLGEGKLNKVSTFQLLNRVFDFFISENVPSERGARDNSFFEGTTYHFTDKEWATDEQLFIGSVSAVEKLVSSVASHSDKFERRTKVKSYRMLKHVLCAEISCENENHVWTWTSSPHIEHGQFLVNARLTHGYLPSGMLPNHFVKFCDGANIGSMGESYIKEFQSTYKDVVSRLASESKTEALQEEIATTCAALQDDETADGINILTDARHCWRKNAAFSDVVCMGQATHKILDLQTISKKEDDPCTQRHELIGIKRIYNELDNQQYPVHIHAHDNNNQITKYVLDERCPTKNAIDTWHMTKSISKNAKRITSGYRQSHGKTWHEELSDKAAALRTHIYHFMKNCDNSAEKLRENMLNFIEHYQGRHDNCLSSSRCKTDGNYECSKLLLKSERAVEILTDFLKGLPVYKDAEKFRYCMDTHFVESFNNSLLQFVDKRISFGYQTYKLRIDLALPDWNENIDRDFTSESTVYYKQNPEMTYKKPVKNKKHSTTNKLYGNNGLKSNTVHE